MKPSSRLAASVAVLALATITGARAQIIISNSLVSYSIQQSTNNVFIPASPLVSETPDSQLELNPVNFAVSASGGGVSISTVSGVLNVDMDAAAGQWFTGDAVTLDVTGAYSMTAPFSASEAFTSLSGNWSLSLYEVDYQPFGGGFPMSGLLDFDPAATFTLNGPGATDSGLWTNFLTFDINTIKAHFGVGPASQVTGLRLQYSPSLTAAASAGSATVQLSNVVLTNQVIPEPSTYALLLLTGAGAMWWARRKR